MVSVLRVPICFQECLSLGTPMPDWDTIMDASSLFEPLLKLP